MTARDIFETDKEIVARAELPGGRRGETRAGERMFEAESGRGRDRRVEPETGRVHAQPHPSQLR